MDKRYLESSEFYNKRFSNFATLVVIPIALLVSLLVIFSFFAHKQIVVKTTGELTANRPLAVIQSTSSNRVVSNELIEGRRVHVGQQLVKFDDVKETSQIKLLKIEKRNDENKIFAIKLLKQGINQEKNVFGEPDAFGMADTLADYLSQLKVVRAENNLKNASADNAQNAYGKQQETLKSIISQYQGKISDYQAVKQAITRGGGISASNSQKAQYDQYISQAKELSATDLQSLKSQTDSDLQSQIDQLTDSLNGYVLQEQSLTKTDDPAIVKTETVGKETELKQEALVNADKEDTTVLNDLDQIKAKLKMMKSDSNDNVISAPQAGIVHRLGETEKGNYYPEGTKIAKIYPRLTTQRTLSVVSYLPSEKCLNLKVGQPANFQLTEKQPKAVMIRGKISKIDSAARQSSHGSYFKVTVRLPLSNQQRHYLRYGIDGQLTLVTGKKTYFNYYKDLILQS